MEIKTFGVIGAGQMGNGIAQVAAMSGLDVVMNDIKTEFVERGLATITKILTRNVDKGKMTEDEKNTVLGRIKPSIDLQDMSKADFVVEAATENEDLKFKFLKIWMKSVNPGSFWQPTPLPYPSAELPPKPDGRKK